MTVEISGTSLVGNAPQSVNSDRRRLGVRHAMMTLGQDFLFWWVGRAPWVVLRTQSFFLWFAFRFSRKLRIGPRANARRILGAEASDDEVEKLRRAMIRNGLLSVYELGRALRLPRDRMGECIERVDGYEQYVAMRQSHRGAILVTAHTGPFELGLASLVQQEKRVHVVFQPDDRAGFERLRSRLRERLGVVQAPVNGGLAMWMGLRDALLSDEVILVQGDRVMPGQRGERVPFMGGHMLFPPGPVKLAIATGCPMIPIFAIRTGVGRMRVVIEDPILVEETDGAVNGDHPALRKIASVIEKHVRARPEQWTVYESAWCEDQENA